MNCGTCRECKINLWVFEKFGFLKNPKQSKMFRLFRKCYGFFGVFVKGIVIFILDSDSLYLSLYGDMV